jgi:hypothetical protein
MQAVQKFKNNWKVPDLGSILFGGTQRGVHFWFGDMQRVTILIWGYAKSKRLRTPDPVYLKTKYFGFFLPEWNWSNCCSLRGRSQRWSRPRFSSGKGPSTRPSLGPTWFPNQAVTSGRRRCTENKSAKNLDLDQVLYFARNEQGPWFVFNVIFCMLGQYSLL